MPVDLSILRTAKPLTADMLDRMHTKALLQRLTDLRSLQENPAQSDWSDEEVTAVKSAGLIAFKETSEWVQAFNDIRAALDKREHIPRGGKEARRAAQQEKQTR